MSKALWVLLRLRVDRRVLCCNTSSSNTHIFMPIIPHPANMKTSPTSLEHQTSMMMLCYPYYESQYRSISEVQLRALLFLCFNGSIHSRMCVFFSQTNQLYNIGEMYSKTPKRPLPERQSPDEYSDSDGDFPLLPKDSMGLYGR